MLKNYIVLHCNEQIYFRTRKHWLQILSLTTTRGLISTLNGNFIVNSGTKRRQTRSRQIIGFPWNARHIAIIIGHLCSADRLMHDPSHFPLSHFARVSSLNLPSYPSPPPFWSLFFFSFTLFASFGDFRSHFLKSKIFPARFLFQPGVLAKNIILQRMEFPVGTSSSVSYEYKENMRQNGKRVIQSWATLRDPSLLRISERNSNRMLPNTERQNIAQGKKNTRGNPCGPKQIT